MYLLVACAVLIASMALFKVAAGSLSLRRVNMSTYPFYVLVATGFVGSTAILYGLGDQRPLDKLADERVILIGWIAIMYAMLAIPSGMLLCNAVLGRRADIPKLIRRYRWRDIERIPGIGDKALYFTLQAAMIVCAMSLLYTWWSLETVPLFSVLRGVRDTTELSMERANSRLPLDWVIPRGVLDQLIGFLQVITFAFYAYWMKTRRRSVFVWMLMTCVITILSLTYQITKTPIVLFLLAGLIAAAATRGGVKRSTVATSGVVGSVIVVAMYVVYRNVLGNADRTLIGVWYDVVTGRIATGNLLSFYYSLDIFPRVYSHIGFASTGRMLHEAFGLHFSPDYGLLAMAYWDPVQVASGAAGHMSAIFLAEAWANFGWPGLLVSPWVVGFVIQACHCWFLRSPKSPLHIGLYAYMTCTFPLTTGFVGFYYPAWLIQLGVVAFVVAASAAGITLAPGAARHGAYAGTPVGKPGGHARDL